MKKISNHLEKNKRKFSMTTTDFTKKKERENFTNETKPKAKLN